MPTRAPYSYAVLRVVPRVERQEFVNVGIILYCQAEKFLAVTFDDGLARVRAFGADLDLDELKKHLEGIRQVCEGKELSAALSKLSLAERFDWLVAPKSTTIQTSPVHSGLCTSPHQEIQDLFEKLVR